MPEYLLMKLDDLKAEIDYIKSELAIYFEENTIKGETNQ